jgi:signal peptidase I
MADKRGSSGSSFSRWRKRRRVYREAKHLVKEARRILKRHRKRIKAEVAKEVQAAVDALREALKGKRFSQVRDRLEKLDELVDRHLAFGRKSALREYTESIGVAVLIALLLRAFVVEAFKIPSGSMIPTLKVGDHIFVNKFIYGFRLPFTNRKLVDFKEPRRGEVIVFIYPKDPSKDFIKRIVAVGGDTIGFRDNQVIVNGKPIPRRRIEGPCLYPDQEEDSDRWEPRPCVAYMEQQGDISYRVIYDLNGLNFPDRKPEKIPEGRVFVMGDNRDNSHDSRYWGTVPDENIKGRAIIIWWSYGQPDGVRWRRFFDWVHAPPEMKAPHIEGER